MERFPGRTGGITFPVVACLLTAGTVPARCNAVSKTTAPAPAIQPERTEEVETETAQPEEIQIVPESTTESLANTTAPVVENAENPLDESRFSLGVKDAPLLQVFNLLSLTTPARFRYAAPPDVIITAAVQDVALVPNLETILRGVGWRLRRDGSDLFVASSAPAWTMWSAPGAPPAGWNAAPAQSVKITVPADDTLGAMKVENTTRQTPKQLWRALTPDINAAQRPGLVLPRPVAAKATPSAPTAQNPLWLRWRLPLKVVPPGARVLLETSRPATLYINGAPLARNWQGLRQFDLSRVLRRGDNIIALHWKAAPPVVESTEKSTTENGAIASPPLLRYEWFFGGGIGEAGADASGDAESAE